MRIGNEPFSLVGAQSAKDAAGDLRKAAEGFEAIFLETFMKEARKTSLGEDLLGGSAVDATRDMFDTEVTRIASLRSGLGIADAVERQFRGMIPDRE